MFSVNDSLFSKAPIETLAANSYRPFFVKNSRMFPNIYSSQWCSTSSEAKPVKATKEKLDTIVTITPPETSLAGIGSLLMDEYPDPDSPYESDSDDDKLYIDLDPPANFQRRVSVNCFTTPLSEMVEQDEPVGPDQEVLSANGPTVDTEKSDDGKETPNETPVEKSSSMSAEKPKEKSVKKSSGIRNFANKSSQTELEYIIPSNFSSLIDQIGLEQGKEVLQPLCRNMGVHGRNKKFRSRVGVRDRMWSGRDKPYFKSVRADRCYMERGEETPTKRRRGPCQVEDDSDMDPPIRTIT